MALHPNFPDDPHAILDPAIRWFPADEALREKRADQLMPPLVPTLRKEVKAWRERGYEEAAETSKSLLRWWFAEPHLLEEGDGSLEEFRYFFAQREALETIVYLYDVVGLKGKYDLMRFDSSGAISTGMFDESWRRLVVKMATGAGKTKVLSLALAWSFFHKLYEPDSQLARNFLVIAPNIIVLDRIYKDFQGLRIFFHDPVLPDNGFEGRNWRDDFQLTLHVQDEVRVVRKTGNIFLTNIHRVYAGNETIPSADDEDTMDYFLGPRPTGATTDSKVDLGMIVRDIEELAVFNDEAHHIHDAKMAWFKSIEDIHNRLLQEDSALALQVDVTATPRHDNGAIFVQTVVDYPLVEAISQNVVKHPVLPDQASRAKLHERHSAKYTEKYADYLNLGVIEWRKAYDEHEKLGKKAILFVMTDDTKNCDDVAAYLEATYPDLKGAVLVIHTKSNGEISFSSVIGYFAQTIMKDLRLVSGYDALYPKVKAFVRDELFGQTVDLENANTLRNLSEVAATKTIIDGFKRAINALTVQDKGNAEIRDRIKLRQTRPFVAKDQGFLVPKKSVFSRIIGDGGLELEFAAFLDGCDDIMSFGKNYLAVGFKLDYVNSEGNISNYIPDFFVKVSPREIYIVETKGQEELDLPLKMARLKQWCDDINQAQQAVRFAFVYVDEESYKRYRPKSFADVIGAFREYR